MLEIDIWNDHIINVVEDNNVIYSFNTTRLLRYWYRCSDYGISAVLNGNEMNVILETSANQSSIFAIVDIEKDKIVHCHNSPFCIDAITVDDKLIILHYVYMYGVYPHFQVGSVKKYSLDCNDEDEYIEVPGGSSVTYENYDHMTVDGSVLSIYSYNNNVCSIDISKLLVKPDEDGINGALIENECMNKRNFFDLVFEIDSYDCMGTYVKDIPFDSIEDAQKTLDDFFLDKKGVRDELICLYGYPDYCNYSYEESEGNDEIDALVVRGSVTIYSCEEYATGDIQGFSYNEWLNVFEEIGYPDDCDSLSDVYNKYNAEIVNNQYFCYLITPDDMINFD